MARKMDDIFNECYERIRSGESLESCLRSYPQYRAQLEPLLRTTFDIGRRMSYIHPRPEFKHWAQVRIESVQRYPRQQTMPEAPAVSTWWRHGWAVVVSIGIILMLTTGSTMAASSQALPDQALYPVKLATEEVQRVLTISPERKAQLETDIANIRAAEVEAMANAGKTDEAAKAVDRYNDQFEQAIAAIVKAEGTEVPPVIIPPAGSLPPATNTPPAVTPPAVTPPTVTPTSENTTPPVVTPPVVTPPTVTPPAVTSTSDNITPPVVTTTSDNTTPPETTMPPETTTQDKGKASKNDKLRESLDKSKDKSLQALQDAKEKATQNAKANWQNNIDNLKKNQDQSPGNKDTTSKTDNVTQNQTGSGGTGKTVQSDNKTAPPPTKQSTHNRR